MRVLTCCVMAPGFLEINSLINHISLVIFLIHVDSFMRKKMNYSFKSWRNWASIWQRLHQ